MTTSNNKLFPWFLVLTSITGGALIMVVEVLGSKVIGPFFGASLFVWTSLIAVAMIALALGYALGGVLSDRRPHADYLYGIIALSGFFVFLIPLLAPSVIMFCVPLGLRAGAFFSSCLLFGPSLFLMGCISPYVIKIAAREMNNIGRTVGSFYAISTVGSVLGTVATGFLLIAFLGVKQIFFITSVALLLLSVFYFVVFRKKYLAIVVLLPFLIFWPTERSVDKLQENGTRVRVVASKDGNYGNIKVVDYSYGFKHTRELVIDGSVHSGIDMNTRLSIYPYYYILGKYPLTMRPGGGSCLVLGLGAGVIPTIYQANGVTTDVLDIDPVVLDFARDYFGFHNNGETYIEDARYFLNRTPKKYDYIVLDVFSGETMPTHLLSLEAFELIQKVMVDGGILAFNLSGSVGEDSYMTASVIKTLQQVFDQVDIYPNFNPRGGETIGNISVLAYDGTPRPVEQNLFGRTPVHPFVKEVLDNVHTWRWQYPAEQEAIVLTDNYIPVEFYNSRISERIRQGVLASTDWEVLAF